MEGLCCTSVKTKLLVSCSMWDAACIMQGSAMGLTVSRKLLGDVSTFADT